MLTEKPVREYTPAVYDSYKVLDWSEQITTALANGGTTNDYFALTMSRRKILSIDLVLSDRLS